MTKSIAKSIETKDKKMWSVPEVCALYRIGRNDLYAACKRKNRPVPCDERGYIYADRFARWYEEEYGVRA